MIRDGIFRKSGGSDTGGCVEVAALPGGGVAVRDTKNREGGTQVYTDHEWRCFLAGAKHGEFDLPD
jgi:Domain of unknown function (DUF397)